MATGKIKTLYSDEAKTEALFPRTKTSAVSDENGRSVDVLLDNMDNKIDNLTAADVGARPDSWLPTAHQINAVHEVNYGGSANNDEEFMAIIQNCVDALETDRITHVSIMMHGRHSVIIHKHLNGYVDIEDISYQYALSTGTYYYKRVRSCYAHDWYPWEWENPPMIPGVEYRTTERWNNGKSVWTQLIDFGVLPNNTHKTKSCATFTQLCESCFTVTDGTYYSDANKEPWITGFNVSSGTILLKTNTDVSAYTATVQLWYVKD